jgi:hypothetical protein
MASDLLKVDGLSGHLAEVAKGAVFAAIEPIVYSTASGTLFNVPANTYIVGIFVDVTTAFTAGAELVISDTDGVIFKTTTGLENAASTGMAGRMIGKLNNGAITYTLAGKEGETMAAGAGNVILLYKVGGLSNPALG